MPLVCAISDSAVFVSGGSYNESELCDMMLVQNDIDTNTLTVKKLDNAPLSFSCEENISFL